MGAAETIGASESVARDALVETPSPTGTYIHDLQAGHCPRMPEYRFFTLWIRAQAGFGQWTSIAMTSTLSRVGPSMRLGPTF